MVHQVANLHHLLHLLFCRVYQPFRYDPKIYIVYPVQPSRLLRRQRRTLAIAPFAVRPSQFIVPGCGCHVHTYTTPHVSIHGCVRIILVRYVVVHCQRWLISQHPARYYKNDEKQKIMRDTSYARYNIQMRKSMPCRSLT